MSTSKFCIALFFQLKISEQVDGQEYQFVLLLEVEELQPDTQFHIAYRFVYFQLFP